MRDVSARRAVLRSPVRENCTPGTVRGRSGNWPSYLDGLTKIKFLSTIVHMKVIADTNTFIAVALNEPEKDMIIRLTEGYDLVAPEVLPFEIGNALTTMMKKNALKTDEVVFAWDMVQHIPVELRRIDIRAALNIATECNIYAYDAYFLECALNLRSPLLTLDRRMKEIAQKIGIQVME